MIERVRKTLKDECCLSSSDTVVIGVSGGPDSVCLLHLLWQLRFAIIVAHLDHQIRPESEMEAQFVADFSRQLNLPFASQTVNVRQFAEVEGRSIEESARILRYQFIFETAQKKGAQAVITAHNADDQVETVLMHFLRGSGLSGLRGMQFRTLPNPWNTHIPLLRPMLNIWREEIMAYLGENQLKYCQDASNLDLSYYRNRLRHELLPILGDYNPGIRRRIWQTSIIVHQDLELLDPILVQAWNDCLRYESASKIAFDTHQFANYSSALQRHLFRRAGFLLRPEIRDLDFNALQRVVMFIRQPSRSKQMDWIAGLHLSISAGLIWLLYKEKEIPQCNDFPLLSPGTINSLPVPGEVLLDNDWMIRSEIIADVVTAYEQARQNPDPYQVWIDPGDPRVTLSIRTRLPGDVIKSLGMNGHTVKISDLMINQKIEKSARDSWPLVLAGDEIAWVPGLRVSESFRLKPDSRLVIYLRITQPGE